MFIFYPILFFLITRGNAFTYFWVIKDAAIMAFGTSSSAASLTVALQSARKGRVSKQVRSFVIPFGAVLSMDGTALGFPIMVFFVAQLYDINLKIGTQITLVILSMLCSSGAAPIPNAGMIYLLVILEALGNGLNDDTVMEMGVATLFLLDWIVDRIETAQNVVSDQYVAKMVDYLVISRSKQDDNNNNHLLKNATVYVHDLTQLPENGAEYDATQIGNHAKKKRKGSAQMSEMSNFTEN